MSFVLLPNEKETSFIVFCDFDETYYPHHADQEIKTNIYNLEEYIRQQSQEKGLKLGWVTGSSLDSVFYKMKKVGMRYLPHFIASDLGTEITYFHHDGTTHTDQEWLKRIKGDQFNEKKIYAILSALKEDYDIVLESQTQMGISKYKYNYYYYQQNDQRDDQALEIIRRLAKQHQVGININRCNPLAGDPEKAYDIDFIPLGTGKGEIVGYMLQKHNLFIHQAAAFGDSGNDLNMLRSVEHGYLLANATEEAKAQHTKITDDSYAKGILITLKNILKGYSH
ncbi:HAD-IIB family hydrolase [Risungbinella massiliensis]|uniref:HAD-IIB family hydrolase n=1 Tax=Risungbinella massiliensis TaxID=1329796 RepID=UPI0005CBC06E|nr:HAD-IIB family hydrolase [Risungbinella massiliensis]